MPKQWVKPTPNDYIALSVRLVYFIKSQTTLIEKQPTQMAGCFYKIAYLAVTNFWISAATSAASLSSTVTNCGLSSSPTV